MACSPVGVQWTGLDWTGLDWTPVDWALYQPIWPGKMGTGIHCSPLQSIWIMWGRVKTSDSACSQILPEGDLVGVSSQHIQNTCGSKQLFPSPV